MIAKTPLVGFTVEDASHTPGVLRFYVRRGITVAAGMSAADGLRSILSGVTGCSFTRQSVIFPFVAEESPHPALDADGKRVGVFIFQSDEPNQFMFAEIAGILDNVLMTDGELAGLQIDPDSPAVAAFVAEMTSGRWTNPFGYAPTRLVTAFLQIRP